MTIWLFQEAGDGQCAADDIGLGLGDFVLEGLRHGGVEIVIGGEIDTAIGEGVGDSSAGELAVDNVGDGLEHSHVDFLLDGAEFDIGVFIGGDEPVGIDADDQALLAGLAIGSRAEANAAGDRHDDVGAFLGQGGGSVLAIIGGVEVTDESTLLGGSIPAQDFDGGTVDLVVVLDTRHVTIHEDGDGGELDAAEGTDGAGLGHACGQVPRQEGGLVGLEGQTANIGQVSGGTAVLAFDSTGPAIWVGVVNDGEFLSRVSLGSGGGINAQQEADGDDEILLVGEHLLDVLGIIGLLGGLQELAVHAELVNGILDTFPGGGVEGLVVHATQVGHLTNFDLDRCGLRNSCSWNCGYSWTTCGNQHYEHRYYGNNRADSLHYLLSLDHEIVGLQFVIICVNFG